MKPKYIGCFSVYARERVSVCVFVCVFEMKKTRNKNDDKKAR